MRVPILFVLRLRLILQQDVCLVSICFALFVVNNAQREFCHTNMSSDLVLLSSMKMNLNDTIPYFQEVGGVSNHLISYKLWNISSRYIVSHHSSNWINSQTIITILFATVLNIYKQNDSS